MSDIIQTVSYHEEEAKTLKEKLKEHLGIHNLLFRLAGGETVEGVISEIGKNYVCVLKDNFDIVIPIEHILYYSYQS